MSILAALLLLTSSAPADVQPLRADMDAIVYLDCGAAMGTAWKIDEDTYVTAEHVVDSGTCRVNGEEIRNVVSDKILDFATFEGPKSPHKIKFSCRGFTEREEYLAIGHAFGRVWRTYQPWIASSFKQEGYRSFVGESIPGMSGGPVIDRYGKAYGIVNMRWPARSRELRDTHICKDR